MPEDVSMSSDASEVPVDPGATEVTRIFAMLQSDPTMLEQFKTLFNSRPNEKANVLLNDYTFRRMDKFTGADGTWQEWSFNLLMTVTQVEETLGKSLEEIKKKDEPLSDHMFEGTDAFKDYMFFKDSDRIKYGGALYGVLCSLTGGEANSVVRNVSLGINGSRCGFRAYYALNQRYNPKTTTRMLQCLTQAVSPVKVKNVREVPMAIERWESKRALLMSEYS